MSPKAILDQPVPHPQAPQPQYKVEPSSGGYKVEKREVVATTPDLRMVILTLAPQEQVPWHFHHNVSDTFFCMEGPMVIHMRDSDEAVELFAGQMFAVPVGRPHRVTGKAVAGEGTGRCKFAILQGVGKYDFVPLK
jgi:mannose-6-phosphate isomerase-like protein (cupin superfamily)